MTYINNNLVEYIEGHTSFTPLHIYCVIIIKTWESLKPINDSKYREKHVDEISEGKIIV
jgi:hypothetical protein